MGSRAAMNGDKLALLLCDVLAKQRTLAKIAEAKKKVAREWKLKGK